VSIERPGLEQIDGSGATDGQMAAWNATTGVWTPVDPPTAASAVYLLTTVIDGEPALVWDETELTYTEVSLP
jgi:hypothetical protein